MRDKKRNSSLYLVPSIFIGVSVGKYLKGRGVDILTLWEMYHGKFAGFHLNLSLLMFGLAVFYHRKAFVEGNSSCEKKAVGYLLMGVLSIILSALALVT